MKSQIKILIVEDEFLIALLMQKELKRLGYEITDHVSTGETAIESVKINPPDVILMDINLGGVMDGIGAAKQIRSFQSIPIIFVTGYTDLETKEKAESIHPLGYLLKPVEINQIKEIIESKI
ncbi:response regulator [Leptospira ainazelensis]|uniref:response regulator n=1 Tax=Leptospira ainazelensis TaxID=2810034 RepID=UPI001E5C9294|nr:response regulator [Leptospira ainazelensis]